ncbi:MAG: ASKHA domain-containing protein [bacterium]
MKTDNLLSLLQKKGIFIDASCGGKGRCGRCRVLIKGKPRPPDEIERLLIPESLLKKGYRLACRYETKTIPEIIIPKFKAPEKTKNKNTGLAIDIGTTIIKGALVDLNNGKIIRRAKVLNPQQSWGGDVLTRVGFAISGRYGALRKALMKGIEELKSHLGISNSKFTTVVGNPVMSSFYLGESVKNFAHYPFEGNLKKGIYIKNPPGYVFGCIGGFVGGDTIAGIIASGLLLNKKSGLYVDLGTNGEIALITDKKIYAVSTAAGPAFEGVGLSCGSLARSGAIEKVEYNNKKFKVYTIENKPPIGFCASGFIDLLAILLKNKWLTEYGMLKRKILISGFKIDQVDIRKLQLAIGAIHTGIKFLLDYAGICSSKIATAVITGEFGSHLNLDSLKEIGIIPSGIKKIVLKNDLPMMGAIEFLMNKITPDDIEMIRKRATHLELAMQKDFQKRFINGLILKPWN